MKFLTVQTLVLVCAFGIAVSGCATTKNVMNKASFGLIGGGEKSGDQTADAAQETKADRRAREKEEKQQRDAEKRAAKDEKKAREAAAKEDKQKDGKPGLMSRMTFGLVGGEKSPDDAEQPEADAKAAEKDQKRQEKEAREQEKREAKAAKREAETRKKEEKLAAKEAKAQEKEAAKSAPSQDQSTAASDADDQPKEKRTLMSRMTFGLVGEKDSGESDATGASSDTASAEPTKEDKKAQKRAEKEQREADKQATKDAKRAEKEEAKQAEDAAQAETQPQDDQPKEKRTLMSRMTFGLVGGGKSDESEQAEKAPADAAASPAEAAVATEPAQPALPPEQLAMAAPTDAQYDVQPASALDGDARKLAKMPFKTTFDLSTKSASGKGQATASRESYSKDGYGITDLGDVRIAVQGMTFDGESRGGGVVISSEDRLAVGGKSGTGNSAFVYEYAKGVSAVQFGTVSFTIARSVISIGGKSVPIGQGKKLVVVDGQGNVVGVYSAE